jgi:kynurenine formamidase
MEHLILAGLAAAYGRAGRRVPLYEANVPGLENLNALEKLPPVGAYIVALPMKIKGGSGAPLRAIAIVK